ncbi:hypothetical protein BvRS1_24790 [Burkholderia vietnamiensis]|nr:hypothetical protein BvRS1_24790 [Burkholderia vietnamiensis]
MRAGEIELLDARKHEKADMQGHANTPEEKDKRRCRRTMDRSILGA